VKQSHGGESKAVKDHRATGEQGDIEEVGDVGIVSILLPRIDVLKDPVQRLGHFGLRMNSDRLSHQGVVASDFIKAIDMIHVCVGDENPIASIQPVPKRLLAVIGRNIYEDRSGNALPILEPDGRATTKSLITPIRGRAGRARTPDDGNSGGCPRSEEYEFNLAKGHSSLTSGSAGGIASTIARIAASGSLAPQTSAQTATPRQPLSARVRARRESMPPMARWA
jgi:hypothetical protein